MPERPLIPFALTVLCAAVLRAQSPLETTYAHDRVGGPGWTVFFDLDVAQPIELAGLGLNVNAPAGAIGGVDVYRTAVGDTAIGREFDDAWTLAGRTVPVAAAGLGTATVSGLEAVVRLDVGHYGIALHFRGAFAPAYTAAAPPTAFANADVTLTPGSATSAPPGQAGLHYTPRAFNGALHYEGFARAEIVGSGCGGDEPATFYELFEQGVATPDLAPGAGFTMTLDGADYDVAAVSGAALPIPQGPPLGLADDETRIVGLPWPLPIRGGSTGALWVCSNGFIGLEPTASTTYAEWLGELLDAPSRLCVLWNDFNPVGSGAVFAGVDPVDPTRFHVTWLGVAEYGTSNASSFGATFHRSGRIDCIYGDLDAQSGLVGFSHGGGARDPGPVDLSATGFGLRTGFDRPNLALLPVGRPLLGSAASVRLVDAPTGSTAAALLVGFAGSEAGAALSPIGMPDCTLYALDPVFPITMGTGTGNALESTLSLGQDPALLALEIWLQALATAPGENPAGAVTSNAVRWAPGIE